MPAELPPSNKVATYVVGVVVLCAITIGSMVVLTVLRPDKDNTAIIASVLGFIVPVVLALLGLIQLEVKQAVDGRLTQLLALTEKSSGQEATLIEKARVEKQEKSK